MDDWDASIYLSIYLFFPICVVMGVDLTPACSRVLGSFLKFAAVAVWESQSHLTDIPDLKGTMNEWMLSWYKHCWEAILDTDIMWYHLLVYLSLRVSGPSRWASSQRSLPCSTTYVNHQICLNTQMPVCRCRIYPQIASALVKIG